MFASSVAELTTVVALWTNLGLWKPTELGLDVYMMQSYLKGQTVAFQINILLVAVIFALPV